MGKCCQMVMGPAGTGKSTYCRVIQEHCQNSKRSVHVVNLDPAAERFDYNVAFDIRDLISLEDVMEELELGPNGGLLYCMEYLVDNMDWLKDELDKYDDDEYIIFDCPGQVELYSHIPVMRKVLDQLKVNGALEDDERLKFARIRRMIDPLCLRRMCRWSFLGSLAVPPSWSYNICSVFLLDATFITDPAKFLSGALLSLSAMVQLELPHLNVVTKCDLADRNEVERFLGTENAALLAMHFPQEERQRHAGTAPFQKHGPRMEDDEGQFRGVEAEDESDENDEGSRGSSGPTLDANGQAQLGVDTRRRTIPRLARLTEAISSVLDDYTLVNFLPLDITDEEDIALVLQHADYIIQYGEDIEPKQPKEEVDMEDF